MEQKTKETSTRKQALIWWDSLSVWGNPSKEYYMGLYYSDDNVTPERIEEIWKNQVQIPALRNDEHNVEYLEKPNQKQFVPNFSTQEEKLKIVREKFNQKQFKQFDESLFKAYTDKLPHNEVGTMIGILSRRLNKSELIEVIEALKIALNYK